MPDQIHTSPQGTRYRLVASKTTTPTSDASPKPVTVKLKVFWRTTRKWTPADVADYHHAVPQLAKLIQDETYWDRKGRVQTNRFTCEDFAVRVLVQFAASRGLPVKLTTGVRTYKNTEIYGQPEHERYDSTMYGFADMVELTYGAPDMQREGLNTLRLNGPEALRSGDILAQANDNAGIAHHIQLVLTTGPSKIEVVQGNSSGAIFRPASTVMRMLGMNQADPQNSAYAGMSIEHGLYIRQGDDWDYKNVTTGTERRNFLRTFHFHRWNFDEFNR